MAFLIKDGDFTSLEISVRQQKTRSQLKNLFGYTLFLQNNDHVKRYICPISPTTSSIFWLTRLN